MREIQTRWGRRNLGFAWLFAEPLVFAMPVLTMWSILRGHSEHGLPVIPLLWSGYLPLLLFRHVTGLAMHTVRNNAALLYHQLVTPFDIIIGRCALEALGNFAAIALSFTIFYVLGFMDFPVNFPLFLLGFFYMAWWALAVALIVAALSERTDMVEHIWPPISYVYMPLSGCFFLLEWLPSKVRLLALATMPSVHAYEMIRAGLFGSRIESFYSIGYVSSILAVLTFVGLWLVKDVRQYLEFE